MEMKTVSLDADAQARCSYLYRRPADTRSGCYADEEAERAVATTIQANEARRRLPRHEARGVSRTTCGSTNNESGGHTESCESSQPVVPAEP
jgi:hypothetical protein